VEHVSARRRLEKNKFLLAFQHGIKNLGELFEDTVMREFALRSWVCGHWLE
jgi:hypothetical protein